MQLPATSANSCSTRSPTAWPKRSLIDLKLSRSSSMTAVGRGSVGLPLQLRFTVLQERAAVGDAGQRIDRAAVLCRCSVRSFAIASRMKAIEIVNSSASKLSTVSQTLSNTSLLVGDHGSIAPNGVRSR